MALRISTNKGKFFAEIFGVDLSTSLSSTEKADLLEATHENAVLLFRNQNLDEEQHLTMSRKFGGLETTIQRGRKRRVRPEFADISNLDWDGTMLESGGGGAIYSSANQLWHSDTSFRENPPKFSFLYAEEVVESGSETEFCDERAAWDALDSDMKEKIDDFVEFATQECFVRSHTWLVGDLIISDNRCLLHRGRPFNANMERGVMRKMTISGVGPIVVNGQPIDELASHRALKELI